MEELVEDWVFRQSSMIDTKTWWLKRGVINVKVRRMQSQRWRCIDRVNSSPPNQRSTHVIKCASSISLMIIERLRLMGYSANRGGLVDASRRFDQNQTGKNRGILRSWPTKIVRSWPSNVLRMIFLYKNDVLSPCKPTFDWIVKRLSNFRANLLVLHDPPAFETQLWLYWGRIDHESLHESIEIFPWTPNARWSRNQGNTLQSTWIEAKALRQSS